MMTKRLFILAAILLLSLPARADIGLDIADAHAYATTPVQKNGAVFLSIYNGGPDDAILSAESNVAETVELHTHSMDDHGVMMMREVERFSLPSGQNVKLEPAGHHIMLMGLESPLKNEDTFMMTLHFEHHPPMTLTVEIVPPGTMPEHHLDSGDE